MRVLFNTFWVVLGALKGAKWSGGESHTTCPTCERKILHIYSFKLLQNYFIFIFFTKDIYVQLCVFNLLKRSLQFSFYFI